MRDIAGSGGVLSLRVQRGISEHSKGGGIGKSSSSSIRISGPNTVISPSAKKALGSERDVEGWEQIQVVIAKTGSMTFCAMITMFIAGAIAAVGIATGAWLHSSELHRSPAIGSTPRTAR